MINLTTPYDPGSLDTANYTHVEVTNISFHVLQESLNISTLYGTAPGGVFTGGKAAALPFRIINDVPEGSTNYDDFEALLATGPTEKCVDAFRRALCQWLLDQSHFIGTIV